MIITSGTMFILKKRQSDTEINFDRLAMNIQERLKNRDSHNILLPGRVDKKLCLATWAFNECLSELSKKTFIGIFIHEKVFAMPERYLIVVLSAHGPKGPKFELRHYGLDKIKAGKIANDLVDISITISEFDRLLSAMKPRNRNMGLNLLLDFAS
jgi:hypothetical protein